MRPTKLPAFKDEFGPDGSVFFSVRQTRFGVKTSNPTSLGDLKTWFEFELFGTGVDQGQTTFRLRQAYGELGKFGAGQTWSPFMDIDVFPNSLEYWGPNGMVFFRNIQFRWMPIKGDSALDHRSRAAGSQRRWRHLLRPYRTAKCQATISSARFIDSRPLRSTLGICSRGDNLPKDQLGGPESNTDNEYRSYRPRLGS